MTSHPRIRDPRFLSRLASAEQAAACIVPDSVVATSGFTGSGSPKAVPLALAERIHRAHDAGQPFRIGLLTGASTAPELDGALARAEGIRLRVPYQSDPDTRLRINAGQIDYIDMHLSHVAQQAKAGIYGAIDTAVIEVAGITADGGLIPTTSIGNNKTWLNLARQVILEVNRWQPEGLEGLHDIYYGRSALPGRTPIPLTEPGQRIGEPWLRCDPDRIVAIVETDAADRNLPFKAADAVSQRIAGHLLEFLRHEVARGRLPANLLPLQSGVGNTANAVLLGLSDGGFSQLTAFTEVIQDGMLELIDRGVLLQASATAVSLSPEATARFKQHIDRYRSRIVLREQGISNHPELIRRQGCIAMNGMIEADLYGNVNSTHVMGSAIQNGIGGSGDFARNSHLAIFMAPSTAKGGRISSIVPMVSHVDHTEHDVSVVVTEKGLADLRGLAPKQRARAVITQCVHPEFRDALQDYFDRACAASAGKHTPHLLTEALGWHQRFLDNGDMRLR